MTTKELDLQEIDLISGGHLVKDDEYVLRSKKGNGIHLYRANEFDSPLYILPEGSKLKIHTIRQTSHSMLPGNADYNYYWAFYSGSWLAILEDEIIVSW